MTLEELITLQDMRGLRDSHLVHIDESGFKIAHTDIERNLSETFPLDHCSLHLWLEWQCDQPVPTGVYLAKSDPDGPDGSWQFDDYVV